MKRKLIKKSLLLVCVGISVFAGIRGYGKYSSDVYVADLLLDSNVEALARMEAIGYTITSKACKSPCEYKKSITCQKKIGGPEPDCHPSDCC